MPDSHQRPGSQARRLLGGRLGRGLVATAVLAACASGPTVIVPRPDFGGGVAISEATSPAAGGAADPEKEAAMREACFPLGFWVRGSQALEGWTIVPALLPGSVPVQGQRWATSYECVDGQYGPYAHGVLTPFLPPPDG